MEYDTAEIIPYTFKLPLILTSFPIPMPPATTNAPLSHKLLFVSSVISCMLVNILEPVVANTPDEVSFNNNEFSAADAVPKNDPVNSSCRVTNAADAVPSKFPLIAPNELILPDKSILPVFGTSNVNNERTNSPSLPDCNKNNLESGTLIANSPGSSESVVGILPETKLRFNKILSVILYFLCTALLN